MPAQASPQSTPAGAQCQGLRGQRAGPRRPLHLVFQPASACLPALQLWLEEAAALHGCVWDPPPAPSALQSLPSAPSAEPRHLTCFLSPLWALRDTCLPHGARWSQALAVSPLGSPSGVTLLGSLSWGHFSWGHFWGHPPGATSPGSPSWGHPPGVTACQRPCLWSGRLLNRHEGGGWVTFCLVFTSRPHGWSLHSRGSGTLVDDDRASD